MRLLRRPEVPHARLCTAIRHARMALRRARQEKAAAVREMAGSHYSDEGTAKVVPLNLLSVYCSIVGRSLIAKNPRVMLSTWDRQSRPTVKTMEAWANERIEKQHLAGTLQRVVLDALFSVGVAKVALATPADSAGVGWSLRSGEPFVERVSLDDLVYDVHARDFTEVGYIGHRYRARLDVVRDARGVFNAKRKELQAQPDRYYNAEGDERLNTLGRTFFGMQAEEYAEFVDLWEIYLPFERAVFTFADDGGGNPDPTRVIREFEWIGHDDGPYCMLGYEWLPDNVLPVGPAMRILDLHYAYNNCLRKLIRQAGRAKEITAVSSGDTEDGNRILKANDGDVVKVDNPDAVKVVTFGAPNQAVFLLAQALKDLASWAAGNLDIMGGLSPQSKTATQDKMLDQNSARSVADMQDTTVTFTSDVVKRLIWYHHHHPTKTYEAGIAPPGSPHISTVRQATPAERRQVPFDRMAIQVDPYSLQHQTPQGRLAAMNSVVTGIVQPFAQLMAAQGVSFDVGKYLEEAGRLLNIPNLTEFLSVGEPPITSNVGGNGGGGEAPGMPANTSREYIRRSLGQDSSQARAANRTTMAQGGVQSGEANGALNKAG